MEIHMPEIQEIKDDLKALHSKIDSLSGEFGEKFVPKTWMKERYDISPQKCVTHEKDGTLTPYKCGKRVFYKQSDVHALFKKGDKGNKGLFQNNQNSRK